MTRNSRLEFFCCALLLLFAGSAPAAGTKPVTAERIIAADKEPQNWLAHGRTYGEQRYSPLQQVNSGNVEKLGLAWSYATGTTRGLQATPIVVDGRMYTTGVWSVVYALDARTGKELWKFDPEVPRAWGRYACCDAVNRGVALWQDAVYVATLDGRLISLDARTGKKRWEVNTIDRTKPYTITGAPRVVKGKVLIGNGGGEYGVRGYFSAYDAATGKMAWRFYTVPGNPKDGFETPELAAAAKSWTGEWWAGGGGGTAWDSMAFDPELDTLYVGTGNGSPWSRSIRSPGGGDNLFLSSILALDPDTGRLKWHYQTTPADTWDYTATQHMILADLSIEGRTRKVLMQAPKNGFFYVLDRVTGELLAADKYIPATWATHVDLKTGRPVETPEADWSHKTQLIVPAPFGGPQLAADGVQPEDGPRLHPRDAADGHLSTGARLPRDEPLSAPRHVLEPRHRLEQLHRHDRRHPCSRRAASFPRIAVTSRRGIRWHTRRAGKSKARRSGMAACLRPPATCCSRARAMGASWLTPRTPARFSGPCRLPLASSRRDHV
jgi:PQQ-dependent dehydrogenase (methanol/ethanol family)